MAEPVHYPSLESEKPKDDEVTKHRIGFEGLEDSKEKQEEIELLPSSSQEEARRRPKREPEESDTVYFKDGKRKIDFILTYKYRVTSKKKGKNTEEEIKKSSENRRRKRDAYFESLAKAGFEFEEQDPKYYDGDTTFVKVHATFKALARGAEELLIRKPISEVDLPRKDKPWYRDMWSACKIRDPFEFFDPKIPKQFKLKDCFTAPYKRSCHNKYLNHEDKDNFFTSAQRSAITWFVMEKTHYGEQEDQVGVSRLLQNGSFTAAFPLHDGDYKAKDRHDPQNERQLLHHQWSHWTNFYKTQPLENIRHYFGEKIGLYFAWTGFYTAWLMLAAFLGIIIMIGGFFTLNTDNNEFAREICNEANREYFYMCPSCDETCDFWYYASACNFARVAFLFDYAGTVLFAAIMALWAVLFLEFWKRRQFQLQYEWDTLGYEAAEERERPEFVQAIKKKIKGYSESKKKRYKIYNKVLERYEFIQPSHILWPKITAAFSVLVTMIIAVLGVVFAVLIYRLAVSSFFYQTITRIGLPGGPSVADLTVSITGACIQLVAITVMNLVYERLALWLTKWELHRTPTEFEDSFTFKMYLFQFVNYYTSLFYIAFLKGQLTGNPGAYYRVGPYRLDECSTYGCMLELTIQLGIIFVGKQALNDMTELGVPYAKTIIKKVLRWYKERKKGITEEDDSFVRWEKDFEMVPLSGHGLFFEYLELVVQYGFVTIFVAAFPLAPFFAWVNNVIEIRLDAHKFIQVFRRPVAERAQDIGAWFYLLNFVTKLCVISNAFIIAITSQFIDRLMFQYVYDNNETHALLCSSGSVDIPDCFESRTLGFVAWSTSPFQLSALLTPISDTNNNTVFPFYSIQDLKIYENGSATNSLYLPFINEACVQQQFDSNFTLNITKSEYETLYMNPQFRDLLLVDNDERIQSYQGACFMNQTTCRFRGRVSQDNRFTLDYWRVLAVKLAFVILFEHLIFLFGVVLDLLIPDIPQSVLDEIRREKLLASRVEAIEERLSPQPKELETTHEEP